MDRPRPGKLLLAAMLALTAPLAAHASDISFYSRTFNMFDPNDPNAGILAMEEVDIWARIRSGFGIPDLDNPLVTAQTEWYVARPDYIQRATTRASLYLFHVVQELEKRHMPTELALLPFIESAFNPQALSSAKAAGMWQFIPSTAQDFNLKQSVFKDDRRDVLASTDAALTYLQKLYDMFGDWQLALAAYNWGEGSVQRAINKNRAAGKPTDFESLSPLMPAETRNYVPKLQAVKNIIAAPERYNVALPKVDNQPYFVTIGKTRDIDIKVAAQLAELSVEEFKALNPQFNRPVIAGGDETQILLPESNAQKFKANIAKWTHALSSWTAHTVHSARERIETIAAKFHTTPEVIREVNHIPPHMALVAGSTVLVPRLAGAEQEDISPELVENARLAMAPEVPEPRRLVVRVGPHDTLSSIAHRYHVSVADIRQWNGMKGSTIRVGESLHVNVATRMASASHGHASRHTKLAAHAPAHPKRVAAKKRVVKTATRNGKSIVLASGR